MPLRILQAGMGGFGRSWAATVIPEVEDVVLVGCVDIDHASLEKTRTLLDLPPDAYVHSLDQALATIECDAVLCTTVLAAHIPVVMTALSAGKHVLVEKPFAPTLDEAALAVDTAESAGLTLMVSQNYRFFPAVQAVQAVVAGGELGEPQAVYIDFRRYDNTAPYGRHVHYDVPQPLLVDMAIHHFDLMRAVLGREPLEVDCRSWNPSWSKYREPAAAAATLLFDGGTTVSYRGSWLSPGVHTPWAGKWRIEFPECELSWTSRGGGDVGDSDDAAGIQRLGGRSRKLQLPTLPHLDRAGSLAAFRDAVQTGVEPETSGRRNIPTLALTMAAVRSAETGLPVRLGGAAAVSGRE